MDKIEFKDCKIEDLKVGDVYQQEGTLANQSREPLLRVEEPPRLAEKYGLPHLLLRVVAENPTTQSVCRANVQTDTPRCSR